ncbi:hypothetical protein AD998_08780 [bacterium 336/3]|nr:hypothetical protein AD998_08780 [bacterium 336/3]
MKFIVVIVLLCISLKIQGQITTGYTISISENSSILSYETIKCVIIWNNFKSMKYLSYVQIYDNKVKYEASIEKYKDFVKFLEKLDYATIKKLGQKYPFPPNTKSEKCSSCPYYSGKGLLIKTEGKIFQIKVDNESLKDPVVKRLSEFFINYRKEYGCYEERYQIYQLKKGEDLKSIAKKLDISYEALYNMNFQSETGVNISTINNIENLEIIKEGTYILIPCFLK